MVVANKVENCSVKSLTIVKGGAGAKATVGPGEAPSKSWVLTDCATDCVGCVVVVSSGVILEAAAPCVPDGGGPSATYPYSPESSLPQFSYGYPGHAILQSPVDVVAPGA